MNTTQSTRRAYLPNVTRRMSTIINTATRMEREHRDAIRYEQDPTPPEGCSSQSWWVISDEVAEAMRKAGAVIR